MIKRKPVIFCDFDGTITMNDNIIAVMRHFQPEGWETLLKQLMEHAITIQQAVGGMFALLPSARKDEIVGFALDNMRIRPGFRELLEYCRNNDIQFLVTSGGIDFFVQPTLAPFGLKPEQIFCNQSDFTGESIKIDWPHECGPSCNSGCGMCKPTIIQSYPAETYVRIMIGDSITDFAGAKLADVIFARSHLAEQCAKLNMPFYPYEDFYEVIQQLGGLQ